ncbi:MAG: hypothetical protein AAGF30_14485 [Pseudomonadota bacterium]
MAARYRLFASAPGAVFVGALALMRLPGSELSSIFVWIGTLAILVSGYGLICSGFASARLKWIKVCALRSPIADPLPPFEERAPSKDALTRWLNRGLEKEPGRSDWVFAQITGFNRQVDRVEDLTVSKLEMELEGCETRALGSMVASVVFFGMLLAIYMVDLVA